VPYVAKWPGHIAPNTKYPAPISNIDMMPTMIAAAGGTMPMDRPIDGVNLLPYLGSKPIGQPSRALFWRDGPYRAMQEDKWKVIVSELPRKDWLFNLAADPFERVNLATTQPHKLAEMKTKMAAHHAGLPEPLWQSFIAMPVAIDKTLDRPLTPQDEYAYWYN
jgi:uncharacterized sulfatase